jgi:hypothetical protein
MSCLVKLNNYFIEKQIASMKLMKHDERAIK